MSTLKAGPGSCSSGVLSMLSDLEDDPLVQVVNAPYAPLMLKSGASCLGRGMDSPFVGGESSWTVPLSMRMASACSSTGRVEKGQTGDLFLLSVIVVEALMIGLPCMKREQIL